MTQSISDQIKTLIGENQVVLFMKGTKDLPQCGFSSLVVQVLNHINVTFKDVNVLESEEMRQGIKDFASWPTIPQLYIKGEFVGGADIIKEMYQSGELASMLTEQGVA